MMISDSEHALSGATLPANPHPMLAEFWMLALFRGHKPMWYSESFVDAAQKIRHIHIRCVQCDAKWCTNPDMGFTSESRIELQNPNKHCRGSRL